MQNSAIFSTTDSDIFLKFHPEVIFYLLDKTKSVYFLLTGVVGSWLFSKHNVLIYSSFNSKSLDCNWLVQHEYDFWTNSITTGILCTILIGLFPCFTLCEWES